METLRGDDSYANTNFDGKSSSLKHSHSNISSNFTTVSNTDHSLPWFHGKITRDQAENILSNRTNGTFLIRESTNFPGDFTLCLAFMGKAVHYRIYQKDGILTCDHEEHFDNLLQLVSHYKRDADGLCHRLLAPIIGEKFHASRETLSIEDRIQVFKRASLIIRRRDIQLGDIIGHGEFGDVLLGEYIGRKVAVKVSKGSAVVNSLLDEAKFMIGLNHRNLVVLIGIVLDDSNDIFMVIEYMANGNLVDFLRSRGRHHLDKLQLVKFAIDICDGMWYLESKLIVHRDLAARNVLLDDVLVAKISDFGLARSVSVIDHAESLAGKFPIKWTAPEALRYCQFTSKSDVWSLGVLLWEIFSFGRVPYPRIPTQDVVRHIEKGYRMEPPEACPSELSCLMSDSWILDPLLRPNFRQILQRLKQVYSSSLSASTSFKSI